MRPYDSVGSNFYNNYGSNCLEDEKSSATTPEMDAFLPGTGYSVSSSDIGQVLERLERLETVIVNAPTTDISQFATDAVMYNPSNISTMIDSLLTDLNQSLPNIISRHDLSDFSTEFGLIDNNSIFPAPESDQTAGDVKWTENYTQNQAPIPAPQHQMINNLVLPKDEMEMEMEMSFEQSTENVHQIGLVSTSPDEKNNEEDSSIRLVHMLMSCAESVQQAEFPLAAALIHEMHCLLTLVNTRCGIGKVARHFIDALTRRVFTPPSPQEGLMLSTESTQENEFLYQNFYEACPFLKFAHFTANQAILEAFEGHDCVHVIDFNLMHGLQWPALIQALALRPGGPPSLRLTGIGPPSTDGRDSLREIGLRLADLAWSVNVKFTFRGVAATRLDDVKPWLLQVKPMEAVAVNSIMQLHRLLATDPTRGSSPINTVLSWIRSLNPKIVTIVEQEADHNQPGFLSRFTEALYYYSTMFDSLDACGLQQEKAFAEMYIQKEICNVLSCEGVSRVERHEPLVKWRSRLAEAGFRPLHLGSNAFKQATMLLTLFSAEGYLVEENGGCLTLGWQTRSLIAASAWQPISYQMSSSPPKFLLQ